MAFPKIVPGGGGKEPSGTLAKNKLPRPFAPGQFSNSDAYLEPDIKEIDVNVTAQKNSQKLDITEYEKGTSTRG